MDLVGRDAGDAAGIDRRDACVPCALRLTVAQRDRVVRVGDIVEVDFGSDRKVRIVGGVEGVARGPRNGVPGEGDALERMERRRALRRAELRRPRRIGVRPGDGEAPRLRPCPLDEVAVDRLDAPEIGADGQPADGVLGRAARRVQRDHGREGGRGADVPVVGDNPGGVADRRPREREGHGDRRAIGGGERLRRGEPGRRGGGGRRRLRTTAPAASPTARQDGQRGEHEECDEAKSGDEPACTREHRTSLL